MFSSDGWAYEKYLGRGSLHVEMNIFALQTKKNQRCLRKYFSKFLQHTYNSKDDV